MFVKLFKDCLYIGRYKNILQVNFIGPEPRARWVFTVFTKKKKSQIFQLTI